MSDQDATADNKTPEVGRCPKCESHDTERVETYHEGEKIAVVRSCNDCYAGWNEWFGLLEIETTHEPEVRA